jgi:hypothetical protein
MSSQPTTRPRLPAVSLARRARASIVGLLLLGFLGALGLAYAGYRAHRISAAVSDYASAASLYQARNSAIQRLSDLETSFHRFLLDGNSVNLNLMERDKEALEQLAQQDSQTRADKLLQDMVAKEQQWYSHTAQPLIDQRKNLPTGQGISEDFLSKYRTASPDLGVVNFENSADGAYRQSLQSLLDSEKQARLWFLLACLAGAALLIVLIFMLASGALKHIGSLQKSGGS